MDVSIDSAKKKKAKQFAIVKNNLLIFFFSQYIALPNLF